MHLINWTIVVFICQLFDPSPADQQRNNTYDSKTAINDNVEYGYLPDRPGNECQRQYRDATKYLPFNDPYIFYGVFQGANK